MSETERVTRKTRIDSYLRESGWDVSATKGLKAAGKASIEISLTGLPVSSQCPTGNGYADYVLYGDDGKPLAVIEAKRTSVDLEAGKVQAEQYADALQRDYGYKPIVYVCNGYETEIDDGTYPWRRVFGFHTQDELRRLIERRSARISTRASSVPLRDYQRDAVASVIDYYASKRLRSLVVMATGTGKTRIAAGVADLLLKNSFVKRILFIADRKNLASQAMNKTFKRFFPDEGFGLLVEGRREGLDKRVIFTTYNTMMNPINQREFSIGYFDLIIIDEAHRSIFKKWGAIFDYFDAFLLGMTATPKDEVGASTYQVFNLDSGKPNYAYEIMQGVKDGYLTYFKPLDRRTGILREGLRYEDLSSDEKEQYEEKFADPDGTIPEQIEPEEFRDYITNVDTIKTVFRNLFDEGLKVDNGDTLGKTIIFARDHSHAVKIVTTFREMYPDLAVSRPGGRDFCVLIDNTVVNSDTLQAEFEKPDSSIRIVVSVDMMDTGVDVEDLLNLVFFKWVVSKVKFWQMIGRGTRIYPNPSKPDPSFNVVSPSKEWFLDTTGTVDGTRRLYQNKQGFLIFDATGVFEFFHLNPEGKSTKSAGLSLCQRIFKAKAHVLYGLQKDASSLSPDDRALMERLRSELAAEVAGLNKEFVTVRQNLRYVDRWSAAGRWANLDLPSLKEVEEKVVPAIQSWDDPSSAKWFDIICYEFEALRHNASSSGKAPESFFKIVSKGLLDAKLDVPEVKAKEPLLRTVVTTEFLGGATASAIDHAREEIRDLIRFVERMVADDIISNFRDTMVSTGFAPTVDPSSSGAGGTFAPSDWRSFDEIADDYILTHRSENPWRKIEGFEPLTESDETEVTNKLRGFAESKGKTLDDYGFTPVVYARRLLGLSRSAIERFVMTVKDRLGLDARQSSFVRALGDFVSKNGDLSANDLIDVDSSGLPNFENYVNSEQIGMILQEIRERLGIGDLIE